MAQAHQLFGIAQISCTHLLVELGEIGSVAVIGLFVLAIPVRSTGLTARLVISLGGHHVALGIDLTAVFRLAGVLHLGAFALFGSARLGGILLATLAAALHGVVGLILALALRLVLQGLLVVEAIERQMLQHAPNGFGVTLLILCQIRQLGEILQSLRVQMRLPDLNQALG